MSSAPGLLPSLGPTGTGLSAAALPIGQVAEAVALIDGLSADLAFNPGELLALQALLLRLDRLG
jgi:hypothetical protein